MFGGKIDRLRKGHDKLVKNIATMRKKQAELREKISEINETCKRLEDEAGSIIARINLGELPETERETVSRKLREMDELRLEVKGLQSAINELEERIAKTLDEIKQKRVELYLALREEVMKELEKTIDKFNRSGREYQTNFVKLVKLLRWLGQMENRMPKLGYQRDKKPEERFGKLLYRWQIDFVGISASVLANREKGYTLESPYVDPSEVLPNGWDFIEGRPGDNLKDEETEFAKALGVLSLKEIGEVDKNEQK